MSCAVQHQLQPCQQAVAKAKHCRSLPALYHVQCDDNRPAPFKRPWLEACCSRQWRRSRIHRRSRQFATTVSKQQACLCTVCGKTHDSLAILGTRQQPCRNTPACTLSGKLLAGLAISLLLRAGPCTAAEFPQVSHFTGPPVEPGTQFDAATSPAFEVADSPKGSFTDQNDPVNPFTLFGNTRKKFLIENLEGNKVVSRKKGFTTTTCVSGVAAGAQTKQFEALPESAKSDAADNQLCSKTTGPDLQLACQASCGQACKGALDEYADRDSRLTGYSIDGKVRDRLSSSCAKQCTYECAKPGDKYGFAIPYRSRYE